ncbi:MAG: HIT family protein [Steroidobacteraceae bacterium]
MTTMDWTQLAAGVDCPHCAPRPESTPYMDFVAALSVSSLYLAKGQRYRGACALIFDSRHAIRADQLAQEEWLKFSADLYRAQQAVMQVAKPDHLNIALLGNTIPHLHWSIIPRYRHDPRWGRPIWEDGNVAPLLLEETERTLMINELRTALNHC